MGSHMWKIWKFKSKLVRYLRDVERLRYKRDSGLVLEGFQIEDISLIDLGKRELICVFANAFNCIVVYLS